MEQYKKLIKQNEEGIQHYVDKFLQWLEVINYSPRTISDRKVRLGFFVQWCEENEISLAQVTKSVIEKYQRHVYHCKTQRQERPLAIHTQLHRLTAVRVFFKWMARNNHLLYNPAAELQLPKVEKRLPCNALTVEEMENVLRQPNIESPYGLRDRAILELFYSTGIRRAELLHLSVWDLDIDKGVLMVRQGKGRKDRMVPVGERAIKWVEKYLYEVRPILAREPETGRLFLSRHGRPMNPRTISCHVGTYLKAAGIKKEGACHIFRHTMATLMLENNADIRVIQEILGHADLSSTQRYTQVCIGRIKEIHTLTHPSAKLKRNHPETNDNSS